MAFLTSAPTTLVLTVVTISGRFGSDVIFEDVELVEEPPAKLGAGRIGGNARPAVALPIATVLFTRTYFLPDRDPDPTLLKGIVQPFKRVGMGVINR
jgi:hypothetical protein